jgi:hypothetical protein
MRIFCLLSILLLSVFSVEGYSMSDTSIYSKINGNRGEGISNLKGVRNLRVVLNGVLYRSGANNVYGPIISRSNDSPLSFQTLLNLREQGFRGAYYLYNSNFESVGWPQMLSALKAVDMEYSSVIPKTDSAACIILTDVYHSIKGISKGAILVHCWNGWHMSGLMSVYALMQFCDFNPVDAWEYWKTCTDNNYNGFEKIRKRIFEFIPDKDMKITEDEKKKICPCEEATKK